MHYAQLLYMWNTSILRKMFIVITTMKSKPYVKILMLLCIISSEVLFNASTYTCRRSLLLALSTFCTGWVAQLELANLE